jgi:hypothetical protein
VGENDPLQPDQCHHAGENPARRGEEDRNGEAAERMRCPGLTTTPAGNLAVKSAAGVCAVVSPLMANLAAQLVWWAAGALLLLLPVHVRAPDTGPAASTVGVEHAKPIKLAKKALILAIEERTKDALQMVERIADEHGGHGVSVAMITWCELFIDHAAGGATRRAGLKIEFVNGDDPPVELVWAERMILARLAMNQQEWDGTMEEVPTDDPFGTGRHVIALLDTVAVTMQGLPRGYAWMGHSEDD